MTKPGFSFLCLFCVKVILCYWLLAYVCFCCVRFTFFSTVTRYWLEVHLTNDLLVFCIEWDIEH